jgi:hypothetical protein
MRCGHRAVFLAHMGRSGHELDPARNDDLNDRGVRQTELGRWGYEFPLILNHNKIFVNIELFGNRKLEKTGMHDSLEKFDGGLSSQNQGLEH